MVATRSPGIFHKWGLGLLLVWSLAACSSSSPDGTPPGRVETLAAVSATETTATLTWTAPGDNGFQGRATAYDLRTSRQVASIV